MDHLQNCFGAVLSPDISVLLQEKHKLEKCISTNENEIEKCIIGLEKLLEDLPTISDRDDVPTDLESLLNTVSSSHAIEKTACYDMDSEKMQQLLSVVTDFVVKNPGSDSAALSALVKYSSTTGVVFPFRSSDYSSSRTARGSVVSLNVVNDDDEMMCEALWEELCRLITDRLNDSIFNIPLDSTSALDQLKRKALIDQLHLLSHKKEIWSQYKQLRICSLNDFINNQLSSAMASQSADAAPPFPVLVKAFKRVFEVVLLMIDTDFSLLAAGTFSKVITPIDAITSIYFEKIMSELEPILEDLAQVQHLSGIHRRPSFGHQLKPSRSKKKPDNLGRQEPAANGKTLDEETFTALLALIESLTSVETRVRNLYTLTYTSFRGTSASGSLSHRDNIRSVLKSTSITDVSIIPGMEDNISLASSYFDIDPTPLVVDSSGSRSLPSLNWSRLLISFVPPLCESMEKLITDAGQACCQELMSSMRPALVTVCREQKGGKMEQPSSIWQAVDAFLTKLDSIFSLADSAQFSSILELTKSFVNSTVNQYKIILNQIQEKIAELVPQKCGLQLVLSATSSVSLLRNSLYQLHTRLNRHTDLPNGYLLVYHQFCRAVDSLAQQYVSSQLDIMIIKTFHDSSAFNWTDTKEYYEGERCSSPIQMWNLSLQTIKIDLWKTVPPSNAAAMLADILKQSLDNLTLRYLNVAPSFRRIEQYRMDITMILHVVRGMLFYVVSSPSQLLDLELCAHEQPYLAIHSNCCKLLASLALVTSPLDILYKNYKKGQQRRVKRRRQSLGGSDIIKPATYTHWLSVIDPTTFPPGQTSYSTMQTTSALNIHLHILYGQSEPNWATLLQALLMKDLTLATMIATQSNILITGISGKQPKVAVACNGAMCACPTSDESPQTVYEPLLWILARCNMPLALYRVLTPVITLRDQWKMLSAESLTYNESSVPEWFITLKDLFEPCAISVVKSAVLSLESVIQNGASPRLEVHQILHRTGGLPCGCNAADIVPDDSKPADEESVYETVAVQHLVNALCDHVSQLSISFTVLLEKLSEHLPESTESTTPRQPSYQLVFRVVSWLMCRFATNRGWIEMKVIQGKLPDASLEVFNKCLPLLQSVISNEDVPGLKDEHLHWLDKNQDWIDKCHQTLSDSLIHRESLCPDLELDGNSPEEFINYSITTVASQIGQSEKGHLYLRLMYNLLVNNRQWITESLGLQTDQPQAPTTKFAADVSDHSATLPQFNSNPLELYKRLCGQPLDFEKIRNHGFDWTELLLSDLGVTDLAVNAAISRRPEFQDDAQLNATEAKHVQTLRAKLFINSDAS